MKWNSALFALGRVTMVWSWSLTYNSTCQYLHLYADDVTFHKRTHINTVLRVIHADIISQQQCTVSTNKQTGKRVVTWPRLWTGAGLLTGITRLTWTVHTWLWILCCLRFSHCEKKLLQLSACRKICLSPSAHILYYIVSQPVVHWTTRAVT